MKDRVLCVDDEPVVLAVLKHQLAGEFEVTAAEGGESGLAAIEQQGPFAVVIADYGMPGMNGEVFLSYVRQTSPDTLLILLTGDGSLPSATNAVEDGTLFRFLTKPCPIAAFRDAVRSAAAEYRRRVAKFDG